MRGMSQSTIAAAREAHRRTDGTFGEQARADAGQLDLASDDFDCTACGRSEDVCSADPCPHVLRDRYAVTGGPGSVTVSAGGFSPWGEIQSVAHHAPGIAFVGAAGHGGFKLSPERNAAIPAELRQLNGWYEEDCEAHIVAMFHGSDIGSDPERAAQGVKDWYPDEYEKIAGVTLGPEDSATRARVAANRQIEDLRKAMADQFVTTSSFRASWLPDGYTGVEAERRADGTRRIFAVPRDFWSSRAINDTSTPVPIGDGAGFVDITDLVESTREVDPPKTYSLGVDYSHLSSAAQQRAHKDLGKVYRWEDGSVTSVVEHLAKVGVTGKTHSMFDSYSTSATYYVELGDHHIHKLSKAAHDALTEVPDTTTDRMLAAMEYKRASAAYDADRRSDKARARMVAAKLELERHEEIERAELTRRDAALAAQFQARIAAPPAQEG